MEDAERQPELFWDPEGRASCHSCGGTMAAAALSQDFDGPGKHRCCRCLARMFLYNSPVVAQFRASKKGKAATRNHNI